MMSLSRITQLRLQRPVTVSIVIVCLISVTTTYRPRQNAQQIGRVSGLTPRRFSFNLFVTYGLALA